MPPEKFHQDEQGQWWYTPTGGSRKRCAERACHACGKSFVARPLGARTATHCSRKCAIACRKTSSECGQTVGNRPTSVDGLILASDAMYCDIKGQWWVPQSGGTRARCTPTTCHRCGSQYVPYPNGKRTKTHCTQQCYWSCRAEGQHENLDRIKRGDQSHLWRGGLIKRRGYVLRYAPEHHSIKGQNTQRKYVLEHRLVMEATIGRPLKRNETVHHINGITDDNRPENLELWGYQPAGQRVGEGRHCATCTCDTHT